MAETRNGNTAGFAAALRRLEERLARVEDELRQVKERLAVEKPPEQPSWERLVGMFANDPLFDDLARECRKIREADRKAARARADAYEKRRKKTGQAGKR